MVDKSGSIVLPKDKDQHLLEMVGMEDSVEIETVDLVEETPETKETQLLFFLKMIKTRKKALLEHSKAKKLLFERKKMF